MMIAKGIRGYFIEETWKLVTYTPTIQELVIYHHKMEENKNRKGRISSGVAVIIGPELIQAWTRSGKPPPITPPSNSEFPGRIIVVTLIFPLSSNRLMATFHRNDKGDIKCFDAHLPSSLS